MRYVLAGLCIAGALAAQPQQQQQASNPPAASGQSPTFRTGTAEVLVDLVVRDRRGRPIKDLKPDEIEILENGVKQNVRSMQLLEGGEFTEAVAGGAAAPGERKRLDPMRQLRLVVLVFDRLGPDGRRLSRQAALELFKEPLEQNLYYSVIWLDPRMRVMQPFTNDLALLRRAVERVSGAGSTSFSSQGDSLRIANEQSQANAQSAIAAELAANSGQRPQQGASENMAAAAMAAVIARMNKASEDLSRQMQGGQSITGLWAAVQGLHQLEGRKTVLYFSEGLQLPQNVYHLFQGMIGEANRFNVAIYPIDARGLEISAQGQENLGGMVTQSRQMRTGLENRQSEVNEDARIDTIRRNVQGNLQELAEATGGFLIADSNDLRIPMRRVTEDVMTHYELTYAPANQDWDGKLRALTVRIKRGGVNVQSRNGYFALPPEMQGVLFPHEVPLLRALSSTPLPRNIEYRAAAFRFAPQGEETQSAFDIEIPMKNLQFRQDVGKSTFDTHVSFLVLMKDAQGVVRRKVTRDVPYTGPLDKIDQFRAGSFSYNEYFNLPPGRYVMETAIIDRIAEKVSAKKSIYVVPQSATGALSLSSPAMVRRIEAAAAAPEVSAEADAIRANDPFRFPGGKVIPSLDWTVVGGKGAALSLYFVVYPVVGMNDKPALTIEFYSEGKLIARGQPELPAADGKGRIPYLATSTIESLAPGMYDVRILVTQGKLAAEERASFTVEQEPAK